MEINYMLDTSAINHIIEDKSKLHIILKKNVNLFITYIQISELDKMKVAWEGKYSEAKKFLSMIQIKEKPSSVAILGYWCLGKSKLSDGERYNLILKYMKSMRKQKNHIHDAIIADSAIEYKITLVTDDTLLIDATNSIGGEAITLDEFIQMT